MRSPRLYNARGPAPSLSRGFTLIELIVVVALVGIIVAMGVVMGYDTLSRSSVHEERDLLVSLLVGQRAKAMANVNEHDHGLTVDPADHEYTLFEGTPPGTNQRTVKGDDAIALSGDMEIVFEQLTGDAPDCPCTITVTHEGSSQTIDINEVGRIEW